MTLQIDGQLTALLWVWTALVTLFILLAIGVATTVAKALAQYLTTARVTLSANVNANTIDELKAMMEHMARGLKL